MRTEADYFYAVQLTYFVNCRPAITYFCVFSCHFKFIGIKINAFLSTTPHLNYSFLIAYETVYQV